MGVSQCLGGQVSKSVSQSVYTTTTVNDSVTQNTHTHMYMLRIHLCKHKHKHTIVEEVRRLQKKFINIERERERIRS